jgi:hypothetical protein
MALAHFVIHSIETDLWVAVQTRAQREKWPVHGLCLQWLRQYATGAWTPAGDAKDATIAGRFNPHTPLRTVVIRMRNGRYGEHRLQCIAASEAAGNLLLVNHEGELVGRFPTTDVDSWFFDD